MRVAVARSQISVGGFLEVEDGVCRGGLRKYEKLDISKKKSGRDLGLQGQNVLFWAGASLVVQRAVVSVSPLPFSPFTQL